MRKTNILCIFIAVLCQINNNSAVRFRSIKIIPERAAITYSNPKYLKDVKINVRRSSKGGSYVFHISGTTLHTWANNVSLTITLFEYLHNEYRPTFVKVQYKFCDFINVDPMIGKIFRENHGIVCPLPKGFQNVSNVTLAMSRFPYVFPVEKGKADIVMKRILPTEEIIVIVMDFRKITPELIEYRM